MKLYKYCSNNSGGNWWLKDEDWYALEQAGWKVEWIKDDTYFKKYAENARWLGALATEATKEFPSKAAAIEEFERITGQSYNETGCECCGSPHSIYEEY